MIYTLAHADTCLPDCWSGHHLPHISVPVYRSMTADDDVAAFGAMLGAVQALEILRDQPFTDLEDDEDVFAFFVFVPAA